MDQAKAVLSCFALAALLPQKHLGTVLRTNGGHAILLDGTGLLVGYAVSGRFTADFLGMVLLALPIMALFLYIGGHVHTRLTKAAFQRGISVLLIVSGGALLLK